MIFLECRFRPQIKSEDKLFRIMPFATIKGASNAEIEHIAARRSFRPKSRCSWKRPLCPARATCSGTPQGKRHKPEFLKINPNAKLPAIVNSDVTVFDSSALLAPRREDRQVPAAKRRIAVMDFRVVRRRPISARPCISTIVLRHQPLRLRGAASCWRSQLGQAQIHARQHLHDRRHERLGLGADAAERGRRRRLGQGQEHQAAGRRDQRRPAAEESRHAQGRSRNEAQFCTRCSRI